MRPLPEPARIRVSDECPIKKRIQNAIDRMVQQSVADAGLMDTPRLRIVDGECLVRAVAIGMMVKIGVKVENITHESQRELLDIGFPALVSRKFSPGSKEVLSTRNISKRMSELNSHESEAGKSIHTHTTNPPIIGGFIAAYKLWDGLRNHFPKKSCYSLGAKIDDLFLDTIELLFIASYVSREAKIPFLKRASIKLDTLKFFLQISWELKVLDSGKYAAMSEPLNEIGKMLGGWTKGVEKRNPGKAGE